MKPSASALRLGENQTKIDQAASLLLLSEEGKSERYPGKKTSGEVILYDVAHKYSHQNCGFPNEPFDSPLALMLAFLFRQLKTSL